MSGASLAAERLLRETEGLADEAFIAAVARSFPGRIAFASSLGPEDQVLTHLLMAQDPGIPIFTLDTGRLPEETYELIQETRSFFGKEIELVFPDSAEVEELVRERGPNLFYESVDNRKACCNARKVLPLKRKLAGYDAWITGLRRSQSVTRGGLARVEHDAANDKVKINPLVDWSREAVWSYLRAHALPYNKLHDRGFPSIGCAPCTRAVRPGEDERAGRWWWERADQRECGIHVQDGKVTRRRIEVENVRAPRQA